VLASQQETLAEWAGIMTANHNTLGRISETELGSSMSVLALLWFD